MRKLTVCILLVLFSITGQSQVLEQADSAWNMAEHQNKPVLLYFSGSDWCPNCIRFEKTILSDSSFQTFISRNLILLRADFPQRLRLPEALARQNETLAGIYNKEGRFPAFVLVKPDRSEFVRIAYTKQHPEDFIALLQQKIKALKKGE